MFSTSQAVSSFAVSNLITAEEFYAETLGLFVDSVELEPELLTIRLGTGACVVVFEVLNYRAPEFALLNFAVEDIDIALGELKSRGIEPLRLKNVYQDDRGVSPGIPPVFWIADPCGNRISIFEEPSGD